MTENERVESEEIQGGVITFPPNTVYLDQEAGILGRWDELDDDEGA